MGRQGADLSKDRGSGPLSPGGLGQLHRRGAPKLNFGTGATPLMALRLLTLADLDNLPDPEWLVDGLVGQNALVVLFGPPGVGKSFLALDLALSIATGRPWLGRKTTQGGVVYVYAEGTSELKHRAAAWR